MGPERLQRIVWMYAISIGIWSGLSMLTGWQYLQPYTRGSFVDLLLPAQARGLAFALLTPAIFYFVGRYLSGINHPLRYVGAYALGAGPFVVIYSCLDWLISLPLDFASRQFVSQPSHTPLDLGRSGFADQITTYIALLIAAHAYHFFKKIHEQEVENNEFQRALSVSELQALNMELHPHFLFNALHGISALIDSDRARAKAMLVKLSNLMRCVLERSGSDLISLREELGFAREYLDLEQMRLGTRLRVEWSIDPDTQQALVPQLILQPLVENAIRHGIAGSRDGGWIEIVSRRQHDALEIHVRNSVGGRSTRGFGVGLRNTHARLRHLYADEARFSFTQTGDHEATATIVVPALGSGFTRTSEDRQPWETKVHQIPIQLTSIDRPPRSSSRGVRAS